MIVFERAVHYRCAQPLGSVLRFLEVEPGDECTHSEVPTRSWTQCKQPISICSRPSLALERWHLNVIRIIIKQHQLAQGDTCRAGASHQGHDKEDMGDQTAP